MERLVLKLLSVNRGEDQKSGRPTDSSYHQIAAMAYIALQRPEEALHVCDLGLDVEPENAILMTNRAAVHLLLNNRCFALRDARRAMELDGDRATRSVMFTLARVLIANYKYEEALMLATELKIHNHREECLCIRGEVHIRLNEFEKALESFNKGLFGVPQIHHRIQLLVGRAIANMALGNGDKALRDISEPIGLMRECGPALVLRSRFYSMLGRRDRALKDLEEAAGYHLSPSARAQFLSERARIYVMTGDLESARKLVDDAARIDSESTVVLTTFGAVAERQGRHDEALRQLNKAIEIDPYFAEAYWFRHQVHASLGEAEAADEDKTIAEKYNYRPYLQ